MIPTGDYWEKQKTQTMAYTCRDCSYTGKQSSAEGRCPACSSINFRFSTTEADPAKAGTRRGSMVLLVSLWGFLIGLIYWKLYG